MRVPIYIVFFHGEIIQHDFIYLSVFICKYPVRTSQRVAQSLNVHNLSIKCQLDLLDKIVKPILLYGCEIWGFGKNDIIERVHLKFCKLLLRLKVSTPNFMVYGELGRYSLEIDIKERKISYWCKLIQGKQSKLSTIAYKLLYVKHFQNCKNSAWINHIHKILNDSGMSYIWTCKIVYLKNG